MQPRQPRPEEQIKPDKLVRVIKKEPVAGGIPEKLKDIDPTSTNLRRFKGEVHPASKLSKLPKHIYWGVAGLIALFVIGFIVSFFVVKQKVKDAVASQVNTLQKGVADLQNLDPQSASAQFSQLTANSSPSLGDLFGIFGSLFAGGKNFATSFSDLTGQLSALSSEISSLESGIFNFAANGQGGNLLAALTSTRDTLQSIDNDTNQLSSAITAFGSSTTLGGSGWYLPLKAQIESSENFLNAFIPWLANPTPHHILVLFQNPSEMRPAGGFLGSYADMTIASGTITDIVVHDIADVDTGFAPKIIPPQPLQLEVTNFRPADANWFFDFPTSASETIALFEKSKLYGGNPATARASSTPPTIFDGAIAISPQVVSDLLSLTGPITITSTQTTFTTDNFLVKIQNIVQQGQATAATYPKAVLSQLSQAILTKLASSTPAQQQDMLAMAVDWINKKDVMAYFKDTDLQGFLTNHGAAGDVYQLPQDFNGDYLAIVDSNIRSDKSDLYISQDISFDAQINADGTITDNLTIDRKHIGNQSPYWWYQTTNQDYLQIFTPDGSTLTNESGGVKVSVPAPLNYSRNGYSTDPIIASIATTTQSIFLYPAVTMHEESGKNVFATWTRTAMGQKTEIVFNYTHRAYLPPVAGTQYQFIFEKQSGSQRTYDLRIDAPLGYVFAENGLASYEYQSDDPLGRLAVNLTLQKL